MPHTKQHARRLAMQLLYQIDQSGETDGEALLTGLDPEHDELRVRVRAVELALAAWQARGEADAKVTAIAPDWPTHRQPPVDRAILRLAYYEMVSGHAPPKVAINEAIDLAKRFGSDQSPPFINGVLDKLARGLGDVASPADGSQQAETP
ncbi:MAG: transcription antitermination factor NusB [Phycisphaeraceae bacterium]|nr:transcription antitermination factor NusB [Phycisphaeraceae bacterium]